MSKREEIKVHLHNLGGDFIRLGEALQNEHTTLTELAKLSHACGFNLRIAIVPDEEPSAKMYRCTGHDICNNKGCPHHEEHECHDGCVGDDDDTCCRLPGSDIRHYCVKIK